MSNHNFTFNEKFCGVAACRLRGSPLPHSAVGRVSLWPCSANERYYILQHYSAGSGGAFAFAEHTELSLASRKTVAFAGRVSLLPYSANVRYCITQPVARTTAMSF